MPGRVISKGRISAPHSRSTSAGNRSRSPTIRSPLAIIGSWSGVLGRFLLEQQEANGTLPATIRNRNQYQRGLGKVNLAEALRFVVPDPNHQLGKRRNA